MKLIKMLKKKTLNTRSLIQIKNGQPLKAHCLVYSDIDICGTIEIDNKVYRIKGERIKKNNGMLGFTM